MSYVIETADENKTLVGLIQSFNKAILALKKEFVMADSDWSEKNPRIYLSQNERNNARLFIKNFLSNLLAIQTIPEYFQRISRNDILQLEKAISENGPLNIDQLKQLDLLLFSIDEIRNVQYRKLKEHRIE